ncbi:MAG: phosphoglycerate dehydrogenase [Longimicrobiales bacterium]|nr:phosphoglycerate dehydrogenase [Longimicrobiales bacterium]
MSDSLLTRPRETIRVLLLEAIHESAEAAFRAAGYTSVTRRSDALHGDDLLEAISDTEIIGIRSRTHLTSEILASAEHLLAIGCFCIGTDQVALDRAAASGIPVFHAPHSNTRSVAELVVGLAVMLLRDVFRKSTLAHSGVWRKTARGSHELRGRTLGIVGYGHIGSQVSILAEAFGMRVVYHDIGPKLSLGNAIARDSLDEVLAESDVVSLHVPETEDTRGLMNAERLDRMKPGAGLINASRGTVVDLDALAERLRDGRIGGAAVDVFPAEPGSGDEPFESPLRGIPNVILTPHVGGSTEEAQAAIGSDVAGQLIAWSDTGATTGAVNFPQLTLAPHEGVHRVLHTHRNRPGVLSALNDVLASRGVNVLGQHLQTRGEIGFVVLDVDEVDAGEILPGLHSIEGTIRARVLY